MTNPIISFREKTSGRDRKPNLVACLYFLEGLPFQWVGSNQRAFVFYISEGGQALEGNGVIPGVEVIPTRAALRGAAPLWLKQRWNGSEHKRTQCRDA
jgi:hypothetical protein